LKVEDAYDIHIIFREKEKRYEKIKKIFILIVVTCKINFIFLRSKFIQIINGYEFRTSVIMNEDCVIA
jgi:hypothetical protein